MNVKRIKLQLRTESWDNIFHCLRKPGTLINSEGNFWAAVQELERQLDVCTDQGEIDIDNTLSPNQLNMFQPENTNESSSN